MQKDIQSQTIAPAPKTVRGYLSSLDVNDHHILYFNTNTVILLPQDPTKPVLNVVHLSYVTAAKFSNDGKLVASIDAKGTLIISQICPDKVLPVKQYDNFFPNARSIDWSADGKRICAVGEGKNSFGRVGLVETGTNAGEISGVTGALNSCSFRPERPFKLVLGGDEMTLKFFDGPPYSFKQSDQSHKGFINQLKYSPKGTYILTGGADRKLTLHDGIKYERIAEKENAHNGGIFGVDWIDEEHFVTCSSDKLIKIWNIKFQELHVIQTGTPEDVKNPKKFSLSLVAVRAFKDLIYAINLEGNILVYKNPLITHNTTLIRTIYGAKSKVIKLIPFNNTDIVLLDSGGRILVYSFMKNKIKALDAGIDIKNIFSGFIQDVEDSKELFILLEDGSVAIYRTSSSAQQLKFYKKLSKVEFKFISSLQSQLIVGASLNKIFIYDTNKEGEVYSLQLNEDITYLQSNGSFVLIGTLKGKLYIYNQNLAQISKTELATFKISTIKLIPENPQPHSSLVLIGDSCANMKLLRVQASGLQVVKDNMGGHSSLITHADSDEKWIYTFSMDGKVNLWDRQTLKREKEMKDIVKGGILTGLSVNGRLAISGDDLLVKVIPKIY